MTPQVGVYTGVDADADIAAHAADLDAHTKNILEQSLVGGIYWGLPFRYRSFGAATANRLYGLVVFVARTMTFDAIYVAVTTGDAGKSARVGIYNLDSDLAPSTLVQDYGTLSVAAAAIVSAVADQQLTKGYYLTVFISDGTPDVEFLYPAVSPLGHKLNDLDIVHAGYQVDDPSPPAIFNALPASFPAGPTLTHAVPDTLLKVKSLD
ncbi:hypothetical protein ES703_09956 [subsurface metagenome]